MTDQARRRTPARRRGVQYQGTVSLGQLMVFVPLLGILGTALATFWSVGREVQRYQDAINHEIQLREMFMAQFTEKLSTMTAQEARDVTLLNQSLTELRQDIRAATAH